MAKKIQTTMLLAKVSTQGFRLINFSIKFFFFWPRFPTPRITDEILLACTYES